MSVNFRPSLFIFFLPALLGCAGEEPPSRGAVFCNINQTEVYSIGSDPTADFNVTNRSFTTNFNAVTCPNVENEAFDSFVSRVKRENNTLTIIQNQFNSAQFRLDFEISGTDLLPLENVVTVNRCTIQRRWEGTLDAATNTATIQEDIIYRGNCDLIFPLPNET